MNWKTGRKMYIIKEISSAALWGRRKESSMEEKRTLGYVCPACHQSVAVERTVFQLAAAPARMPCPCGKSELRTEPVGERMRLTVPCVSCGTEHTVDCPAKAFFQEPLLGFTCHASGLASCFVGEEGAVLQALARLEGAVDKLPGGEVENGSALAGVFLDELVMHEILSELKDIAQRGGISCTCGSRKWKLKVNYSSVDLICPDCGAAMRIPAATQEDITDLCCRPALLIHGK